MHDSQLQNPRNSSLFLWFCSIGSYVFTQYALAYSNAGEYYVVAELLKREVI